MVIVKPLESGIKMKFNDPGIHRREKSPELRSDLERVDMSSERKRREREGKGGEEGGKRAESRCNESRVRRLYRAFVIWRISRARARRSPY